MGPCASRDVPLSSVLGPAYGSRSQKPTEYKKMMINQA